MVEHLEIALPVLLVIIAFLLKLFMDRSATVPLIVQSLYELPVDVLFLAMSFSIAAAITSEKSRDSALFHAFLFLVVILLGVVAWRRSIIFFEDEKRLLSAIIFVLNAAAAAYCLTVSINTLIGGLS